jgi:hypothetical protein
MPPRTGGHKYCEANYRRRCFRGPGGEFVSTLTKLQAPAHELVIRDQDSGIDKSARRATQTATCEAPGVELRSSRATRQRPFVTGGSGSVNCGRMDGTRQSDRSSQHPGWLT